MDKTRLRNYIIKKRKSMTEKEVYEKSNIIFNRLLDIQEFKKASILLCYASYNHEVMTEKIIEYGLENGKYVALPKVENKKMDFFYIKSLKDLVPGYMSIPEPVTIKKVSKEDVQRSFMIIPGTSFDRMFNRNGYGGGYYDRYITMNRPDCIAGITYEFQIFDNIPTEEHDKKVDYIISEVKVYGK